MPFSGTRRGCARSAAKRYGFAGVRSAKRLLAGATFLSGLGISAREALAQTEGPRPQPFGTFEVIQLSTFAGILLAAFASAVWLIRERSRTVAENAALRARIAELDAIRQRGEGLLNVRDQKILLWETGQTRPELIGSLPPEAGVPVDRASFLGFGRWLMPGSAAMLDRAIHRLRERSEPFEISLETQSRVLLEARGQVSPRQLVVRFVSLGETQRAHAALRLEYQKQAEERGAILALLDAIPMPFWLRDAEGRLQWVNRAYARAVDARSPGEALREGHELLGTPVRSAITAEHRDGKPFAQTVSTVIGGDRRMVEVSDVATENGSAGLARDISDSETQREEHARVLKSHVETLDQIGTAVAMFDASAKLRFFNQAFQRLWDLDLTFLDSAPDNALLLDRLRSERKLAEQPEWRRWKENVMAAYRAVGAVTDQWYLPDGRTLRVIANPHPQGGVTWIFENLTEKIDLQSRYQTALRVQRETLDNLAEGVAVFGSDGRIKLSNPAFHELWGLRADLAQPGTHISDIRAASQNLAAKNPWDDFVASVTGFDEERKNRDGNVELLDGKILHNALIHLPNGQVMLTFVDVTDSVNVERALVDKNDALMKSEQLKNAFVQHVSYELRSPLTNIIGFSDILIQPETGDLSPRQRDYLDHIRTSSSVLLTIVNDILDLATVDAGIMALDFSEVSVGEAVEAASALVLDRMKEHEIRLDTDLSAAPASFTADEHRLRQVLVNLLSNAANFAPRGSTVELSCVQEGAEVTFRVHDDGPGMPDDVLDTIFRRFEPRINGGRRRGAGLGLSIVKSFVELHGGRIEIATGKGRGTTVTCRFPSEPRLRDAAE